MATSSRESARLRRALSLCILLWSTLGLPYANAKTQQDSGKQKEVQANGKENSDKKKLQDAVDKGLKMSATVLGSASIEPVLLPAKIAEKIFGREVAQNYAVIALTITNRSNDASLVVNSIFIDYSGWLLSGSVTNGERIDDICLPVNESTVAISNTKGGLDETAKHNEVAKLEGTAKEREKAISDGKPVKDGPPPSNCVEWSQTQNKPNQIASAEYRLVRGELLDQQPWSKRNLFVRSLQLAGTIATAYTFVTADLDITRGISAFSGQVVPGVDRFWPDRTVDQLNRLSDFGFRVNNIVAKQDSDIVVAFFPIDRFLSPGLRKLFLQSPAVFFSPGSMIFDPEARKSLNNTLKPILDKLGVSLEEIAADELQNDLSSTPKKKLEAKILDRLSLTSLNTVRVMLRGSMTVDVQEVAAQIDGVTCESSDPGAHADPWAQAGDVNCVITGHFLSGGKPVIDGASGLGISDPTVDKDKSSDSELHFKMTLSKEVPSGTNLQFKVAKTDSNKKSIDSPPWMMHVNHAANTEDTSKPDTKSGSGTGDSKSPATAKIP